MSEHEHKNLNILDIVIADDDTSYVTSQKKELEKLGFTVRIAENRLQAKQLISEKKPDVVVLDLVRNNKDDGFVLAYEIKKQNSSIPVIMLTAVTSKTNIIFDSITDYEKEWIKADCVLAKPVLTEQLVGQIQKLLCH